MNRMQLLREAWVILKRNPTLWSVTLIGLAIDVLVGWLVLLVPPAVAILKSLLAFGLAAFTTGALITLVNTIADGQPVSLIGGMRAGLRRLFPLLFLNLIVFLPVWIAIVVLSGSFLTIFSSGLGQPGTLQATDAVNIVASILSAVGIVVAINAVTNLIGIGAERALVQDDVTVITALKSGWQLLRSHVRDYVSIAVMLIGVVLGVGLVFAFAVGPLLSGLATGFSQTSGTAPPPALFSPVNVIFILISLIINSLYTAFASSVWTLAYRNWTSQ